MVRPICVLLLSVSAWAAFSFAADSPDAPRPPTIGWVFRKAIRKNFKCFAL